MKMSVIKLVFRNLPDGSKNNKKLSYKVTGLRAEIWTPDIPSTKYKCYK